MDVSVSGTTDQKTYLKKFSGVFSPLSSPWIRLCLWVNKQGNYRVCLQRHL